jgi:hypothetical protein
VGEFKEVPDLALLGLIGYGEEAEAAFGARCVEEACWVGGLIQRDAAPCAIQDGFKLLGEGGEGALQHRGEYFNTPPTWDWRTIFLVANDAFAATVLVVVGLPGAECGELGAGRVAQVQFHTQVLSAGLLGRCGLTVARGMQWCRCVPRGSVSVWTGEGKCRDGRGGERSPRNIQQACCGAISRPKTSAKAWTARALSRSVWSEDERVSRSSA